jgi:hypothetical protein
MAKYTGVLFTAEQYHEIGPFRFPIFKDLTPGEIKAISAIEKASAQVQLGSMELARKIAKENSITNKQALEVLSNASAPENEELIYSYLPELTKLNEAAEDDIDTLVKYGTVLMQYRGEVKLPGEDAYTKTTDWTTEDTEGVHRGVLEAMRQFILWERDGWPNSEGTVGNEPATTTPKAKTST